MTEPEDLDEDLFADLYEADESAAHEAQSVSAPAPAPVPVSTPISAPASVSVTAPLSAPASLAKDVPTSADDGDGQSHEDTGPEEVHEDATAQSDQNDSQDMIDAKDSDDDDHRESSKDTTQDEEHHEFHGPGIREDGKMFIGGLNWETTDQSLRDYFSQFGEVQECTVMRDGASGRSRGFGFLTFKDPKTVNIVMVKEHYLDGKIIDPKRAIPRDEQEKTSKIFVGGVSQEATEQDFKQFFMKFGRVVDATLMMDKDTGRPRGFGFVTFDSEAAVDATLQGPLEILGKQIEVKKAQPRGNMREDDDRKSNNRLRKDERFRDNGLSGGMDNSGQPQNQQAMQNMFGSSMTPQMMAQYWQRMQQWFAMMQQMTASGGMNNMNMMNPMMQMQQMQQMKQMQAMIAAQNQGRGAMSPGPNNQTPPQAMQAMNPAMMQQMQQQMMQQMQGQQPQTGGNVGFNGPGSMGEMNAQQQMGGPGFQGTQRPGFNAQEQLAFEQQKYERQAAARAVREQQYFGPGGPTSWEGMYDDVPQPGVAGGPGAMGGGMSGGMSGGMGSGMGRGMGYPGRSGTPQGPGVGVMKPKGTTPTPPTNNQAPANAPTGPKNAGKPGANYRGGIAGRGMHRGYHPYSR